MLLAALMVTGALGAPTAIGDTAGWEAVNRRGTTVGTLGVAVFGLGVPTELVGVGIVAATTRIDFSDYRSPVDLDPQFSAIGAGVALAGWGALKIAPALTAGGALRARRALTELGEPVPGGAGYASWVLLAGSLGCTGAAIATGEIAAMVGGTGLLLGSFAAGAAQLGVNGAAWRRLHPTLASSSRPATRMVLAPTWVPGGAGLGLAAVW